MLELTKTFIDVNTLQQVAFSCVGRLSCNSSCMSSFVVAVPQKELLLEIMKH